MASDATTFRSPALQNSFPTTHWSVVLRSAGFSPESEAALEELCRAYWQPLYVFARRSGVSPHDAQDLVQGFIQRLIERRDLANVSPDRGRFRTYLLTALRNFIIKQADYDKAKKRGGGKVIISLDAEETEKLSLHDPGTDTAEAAYDRQWAHNVLSRALTRLHSEHVARNKIAIFEALLPFLEGAEPDEYEAVGNQLGMKKGTVAVTVYRMRARLQELLRAEVMQTVGNREEADAELQELLEMLARK